MENLNEDWTADVIGQMHKYRITGIQLAEECSNPHGERYGKTSYAPAYLSKVLNGRMEFKSDEAKENTKRAIQAALARLIDKVERESTDAAS